MNRWTIIALIVGVVIGISVGYSIVQLQLNDANVTVNGIQSQNIGGGKYEVSIPTLSPLSDISMNIETIGNSWRTIETSYAYGNILIYVALTLAIIVILFVLIKKRKHK